MGSLGYDTSEYKASAGFEALPTDDYNLVITDTEKVENKKLNGHQLKVTVEVLDGPMKGRKVFPSFNIWHHDEKPRQIGREQFNSVVAAIGITAPRNHEDIRGGRLTARVTKTEDPKYGEGNDIKSYKPYVASAAPSNAAPSAPAPAAASGKPW